MLRELRNARKVRRMGSIMRDRMDGGLIKYGPFWIREDNIEQDLVIVRDIYESDAYEAGTLTSKGEGEVVVDVGAHIGCFAKLWHEKNPEARIICIEACPENIDALKANVGHFAEVIHAACTYEPRKVSLLNAVRPNCESTGGSVVVPSDEMETSELRQDGYQYWNDNRDLPKITLEDLDCQHIDILKLDCEGSEYSILENTSLKIFVVVGEYHACNKWENFRKKTFAGWEYRSLLKGENGGLFHLKHTPASKKAVFPLVDPPVLRVAVPPGIGDSLWALTKVPALIREHDEAVSAHVSLCGGPPYRAKEFVERFDFVSSVDYLDCEIVRSDRHTVDGTYNWNNSCWRWGNFDWMLQANQYLESGRRLESWLPEYDTDWEIASKARFTADEASEAERIDNQIGPYCVFYLGPKSGNTTAGHNRNSLWSPKDWGRLAKLCRDGLGLSIVIVGAEYDRSYFDDIAAKHIGECYDAIGRWPIWHTFAAINKSKFVVSYQSGIGIYSVYMGVPTVLFWRPYGDSIEPKGYVSFSESMASAWAPKESLKSGRYLPCIYTKCSPQSIISHAKDSGWV